MSPARAQRTCYRVAYLHQPDGWLSPAYLEIDAGGTITQVSAIQPADWQADDIQRLDGFVLPGSINVHSHAHQRGLAGRSEGGRGATEADTFWRWRERMYGFVLRLSPEQFEAIAAQSYLEMLRGGYTSVAEFHYLHQDPDGNPYANPTEMAERVISAATDTGIRVTLLPSLYRAAGVGKPPLPEQRRFLHASVDAFLADVERLLAFSELPVLRIGVAPHSLRAVAVDELRQLLTVIRNHHPDLPIHIHAAEQRREVEECLERLGRPPVQWLLEEHGAGSGWTIIHATHSSNDELRRLAQSGASVALCPQTEANLGDGLFPLDVYHQAGGRWGVGSDSNLVHEPIQELRLLEYGQRLTGERRRVILQPGSPITEQPGRALYDQALSGGAQALAQPVGVIGAGHQADLIELDPEHPAIIGLPPDEVLDGWLVAGTSDVVRNVSVDGRWVIRERQHAQAATITERFRAVMRELA